MARLAASCRAASGGSVEMQIVVEIEHRIDALHLLFRDVLVIQMGSDLVALGCCRIVAKQHVDVRRHVHEMPSSRR